MNNLNVQKIDGRIETFDLAKIKHVVLSAGVTGVQAENIAVLIETWAKSTSINGIVRTPDIKAKLLEILSGINPNAKVSFENFKKEKK